MAIRVVVSGTGNMGREVLHALCRHPDLEPVGVLEKFSAEEFLSLPDGSGLVPFSTDPAALFGRTRPQVVVDFTNAEWTPTMARAALDAGARLVIGTTGLSDEFLRELERDCRQKRLGAVVAANFAIGAVLMIHLASLAARHFDYAEIIELHHEKKADAPSGTAIATARAMLSARGRPFEHPPTAKETLAGTRGGLLDGISIHSVRLPGLVAHQEVILGTLGQTLSIRHDSTSRESFIPGVLLATKEVMNRQELVLGLDKLIGLD
ncbi:MAG: 4-hydroxy-tetrahydrodipicolinate reductase [Longimicrobiales bacterium]|nr:4-hydroxy-tetrahydrodipicolinate reductase [Longimicrobiales bacterium]